MERRLRVISIIFLVALLVHAGDHFRRGTEVVTRHVFWAGNFQLAAAVLAVVLVLTRHRLAPLAAVLVGFLSAIGFTGSHILPHWGVFSDAFTGARVGANVTAFSWFAALFEIAADLAFGLAGIAVLRRRELGARARPRPQPASVT